MFYMVNLWMMIQTENGFGASLPNSAYGTCTIDVDKQGPALAPFGTKGTIVFSPTKERFAYDSHDGS